MALRKQQRTSDKKMTPTRRRRASRKARHIASGGLRFTGCGLVRNIQAGDFLSLLRGCRKNAAAASDALALAPAPAAPVARVFVVGAEGKLELAPRLPLGIGRGRRRDGDSRFRLRTYNFPKASQLSGRNTSALPEATLTLTLTLTMKFLRKLFLPSSY